ncbi:MAG: DUF3516 domain-containing protein [Acidobacteriota bacterium]
MSDSNDASAAARPPLADFLPDGRLDDPDAILERFLDWTSAAGFSLYAAQEEALLELMAGKHVVLNTPTGSGKSLVALGLHFKALCEGKRSFYTSPIKALASEKFFSLCDELGAERVGMSTGDASINAQAPVICCTAEVLANAALRQGTDAGADYVVMDEFHYYGDLERGVAWQVPLIVLPTSRFLLMSATLGNTAPVREKVERRTGVEMALVASDERPVPLDFDYRETSLVETVQDLVGDRRAPIYIVNFTQRECAELAQGLTSLKIADREIRDTIKREIRDFRFDTPYGKECRRLIGFGIGVHHAGLLPKYRLLVEQLAQQGLLQVICGTDTLGVGVNIPIRTVLFSKLSKYDGEKVAILKVRDFKQIAGRAGRKGFDDHGSVVCQAPEHVVAGKKAAKKGKKKPGGRGPTRGEVSWNEKTFQRLIERPPETLRSQFRVSHGMVLNLLQYDAEQNLPERDNFDSLRDLIARCHEDDKTKRRLMREAAVIVRSLHRAGIITMQKDSRTEYRWVVVNDELQWDFSLHQTLSLYLVEALEALEPADEDYALDVLTLVEAILENPRVVLRSQIHKAKGELIARLKAEGVPYEARMERLEEVTHPMPRLDFVEATFEAFRQIHPWVRGDTLHPKSIGRDIYERYASFDEYVRYLGLQRSEGVVLRYLSQLYRTLAQSVPERAKTETVYDVQSFFRTLLERIDSSLLEEWERMLHPELEVDPAQAEAHRQELRVYELFHDPKAFRARVRAELHQLVRALARQDYEEAALCLRADDPAHRWDADALADALAPFHDDYERLVFDHDARRADRTLVRPTGTRTWDVAQTLVDPEGDNRWAVEGSIDLRDPERLDGPLLTLRRIGV